MRNKLDTSEIDIYRESAVSSISKIIGTILGLIFVIIIAWYLTVEEVGLFFFYLMIVYMSSQAVSGVGLAVRKRASSREDNRERLLYSGFTVISIIYIILLFIVLMLFYPINMYSELTVTKYGLFITYLVLISQSINSYMSLYYSGCGNPGEAEKVRNYIGKSVTIIATLVFLFITNSVYVALLSYGTGHMISAIIIYYLSESSYTKPNRKDIVSILRFSKWSIPNNLANDFYQRFDTIILGIMVGSIAVGYYDSTVRIATFGFAFAYGVSAASNVKISGMYEIGENINESIRLVFNIANVFVLPTLIISIFHANLILDVLFGTEYIAASGYLISIIVYQVLQSFRLQFESIFNAIDKPQKITTASILAIIINIITAPILVIQFGGLGAVYSTIISEVFRYIFFQYKMYSELNEIIIPMEKIYQFLISALIIIIIYLRVLYIQFIYVGIIDMIVICILYFSLVYIFCPNTRKYLLEIFNEIMPLNSVKINN